MRVDATQCVLTNFPLLAYLVACGCGILSVGCQAGFFQKGAEEPGAGVPLVEFTARDGRYFPPAIDRLFPAAAEFSRARPVLEQAKAGVVLIETVPLNLNASRANAGGLSFSDDGSFVGFEVMSGGRSRLVLKDVAGDFSRELLPRGASLDELIKPSIPYNFGLSWSRDGNRFAFNSNGGRDDYSIYVGAVGVSEKRVGQGGRYPAWNPRVNEIAFVSSRDGHADVYLVEPETAKAVRVTENERIEMPPEWFPDGNQIVFCSGGGLVHDLKVVTRRTSEGPWQRPWFLTNWQRDSLRPKVSPNGRFVAAYVCGRCSGMAGDVWNLHILPVSAGRTYTKADLTSTIVARDVLLDLSSGVAWTPDSGKIFFLRRDTEIFTPIHVYDLATKRTSRFETKAQMIRELRMSRFGVLSFRALVGVWDQVFLTLTNQGEQLQGGAATRNGMGLPMKSEASH